jgi:predicted peptidase
MTRVEKKEYRGIRYLLYYPKNYVEGKKYPVMFHLHGAGSRGTNFDNFEGSVILNALDREDSELSNGFCVFPQCHKETWFDIWDNLLGLVKEIYNREDVDKSNFNASGISMGGYGIYQVMMCLPELFHKAIVCCGGGMYWNSGAIKNIKFRIFHGEQDTTVFPEESRRMYARLKEACADVSLEVYPECDHNCWEKTYTNYENLHWLFTK